MCFQVDQEFQQNEIKELKKTFLLEMFSTKVCGGKAFAAEQKIHKLKRRISKLRGIKNKSKPITPTMLLKKSTDNVNKIKSAKYGYLPDYNEKRSLSSEQFRIVFNFEQIKKSKQVSKRKSLKVLCARKTKKLRENLDIGQNILPMAERIKKKSATGKFYKSSVLNISYSNKQRPFVISN